jgi:hypothetical protein
MFNIRNIIQNSPFMKPSIQSKKNISFSFLMLVILLFVSASAIAQSNFSGTWSLDEKKSNLGDVPFRIASDKIVIEQDKDAITMQRTGQGPNGVFEIKDRFTFDGKESQNQFFGESKKKSNLSWATKKLMNIKSKASFTTPEGDAMEIDINENYSLSEDGKTLTIDYSSSSSFGDIKQIQVYNKQ